MSANYHRIKINALRRSAKEIGISGENNAQNRLNPMSGHW